MVFVGIKRRKNIESIFSLIGLMAFFSCKGKLEINLIDLLKDSTFVMKHAYSNQIIYWKSL